MSLSPWRIYYSTLFPASRGDIAEGLKRTERLTITASLPSVRLHVHLRRTVLSTVSRWEEGPISDASTQPALKRPLLYCLRISTPMATHHSLLFTGTKNFKHACAHARCVRSL